MLRKHAVLIIGIVVFGGCTTTEPTLKVSPRGVSGAYCAPLLPFLLCPHGSFHYHQKSLPLFHLDRIVRQHLMGYPRSHARSPRS